MHVLMQFTCSIFTNIYLLYTILLQHSMSEVNSLTLYANLVDTTLGYLHTNRVLFFWCKKHHHPFLFLLFQKINEVDLIWQWNFSFKIHPRDTFSELNSASRVPFPYCVNTFLFDDFASCFAFNSSKLCTERKKERWRRKKNLHNLSIENLNFQ